MSNMAQTPKVFLSYSHDDKDIASQLAGTLQENGIDTFIDNWCIRAGDSIRKKIDEGIEECTHFLVLLTPNSIGKPWVETEMDAGFVRKIEGKCSFIPVRYNLPVTELPATLRGLLSPEIKSALDANELVNDIHGVNKKPSLGLPPSIVSQAHVGETGYSAASTAIARLFVEKSIKGNTTLNITLSIGEIMKDTGLTNENVEDAYHELKDKGFLKQEVETFGWSVSNSNDRVTANPVLFTEFDRFFTKWNTEEDAKQLAIDMLNNENFPGSPGAIAKHYRWRMRRAEPAIHWLENRELVKVHNALGHGIGFEVEPIRSALRRFVR